MSNQSPAEGLRQQIEEISSEWMPDGDGDEYEHTLSDEQLDNIMELVTAYAATVEREADTKARLDELKSIREEHQAEGIKRYMYEIVDERLAALQGPQDGDGE
jgi:hypothetical protein